MANRKNRSIYRNYTCIVIMLITSGIVFSASPATLTQSVSDGVETITLRMTLESIRGSNFEVLVQNSSGTYDTHTAAGVSTYIGTVDEYPGAIAAGILKSDGDLWTKVYFDRGYTWFTLGSSKYGERGDYPTLMHMPTLDNLQPGHVGTTTYQWDHAFDVSWKHFSQYGGSDPATCLEQVEFAAMQLKAIYLRDALLVPAVARVVIRGAQAHCPYSDNGVTDKLGALKIEWEANHSRPTVDYDLVAMCIPDLGGGVAWVGTVGTGNSYSANGSDSDGSFDIVARHEIGHNWSVYDNHANNSEGHTINCGNAFGRFAGPEVESILDERDTKLSYLDSQGTYSTVNVPPYAALDALTMQAGSGSVTIDVQINDHDANADSISLSTFDAVSANGNAVTLSSGTGPGGRNELIYTLGNEIGLDSFYYTIIDNSTLEQTATGLVLIYTDLDNTLKGYWNLDETSGTTAKDSTVYGNDASLSGGVTFDTGSVAGQFGNGLYLDGVDDAVSMNNFMVEGNAVTMTAWVKCDGTQVDWAGLFMARGGANAGLDMRSTNELRYEWDGKWTFSTGLYLPGNQWTFVAVVVEPSKATIYMHDGTLLQSVVNTATHDVQTITGAHLGDDYGYRYFKGAIDDARIYDYSLSQAEIEAVIAGGKACNPNPYDGATDVDGSVLEWVPGAAATGYELYMGTDLTAVTNADTGSPEYKGATSNTYYTAALAPSTSYYWRVDTVTAGGTLTGDVWAFTTGSTIQNPFAPVVTNGDFEADGLTTGWTNYISDWYDSDYWGTFLIAGGGVYPDAVDGTAWAGTDGAGTLWQQIGIWGPDQSYEIDMLLGQRSDQTWDNNAGGLTIALYAGGTGAADNATPGSIGATLLDSINVNAFAGVSGAVTEDLNVTLSSGTGMTVGDPLWLAIEGSASQKLFDNITVSLVTSNILPVFTADPFMGPDAIEGFDYTGSIAAEASDPDGGSVTFSMIDGPDWLDIDSDGTLSELRLIGNDDVAQESITVRATDDEGDFVQAQMSISVLNTYTGELGLADFAGFAAHWLDTGCVDVPPCGGADLSDDGDVDIGDLQILAENWLVVPTG